MIFTDFFKAVGQLGDRAFRRVIALGIGLTIALFVAIYAALLWLIERFADGPIELPGIGEVTWIGDLLSWGGLGVMVIFSIFLMIPVASAITSFFLDDIADAVEVRYYPQMPANPRAPWIDGLRDTIAFLGLMISANILAFIAYAALPFAAFPIFLALNGYLLGREYFTLAAMRREGRQGAKHMMRVNRGQIWLAGTLMALPLMVPLLNLFVPVLGAATFTHLYHRLKTSSRIG